MTKKQILELTGLSESEFYKKYPTKESFEKDAKNYKKGGIYIKPENRGKFTETKKRTGKTTEELTHSKNPLTRKRAIFAQNAKKWKHAEGGEVKPDNAGFNALPKNVQDKILKQMSHGGKLHNLNYEVGGKVPKHIATGLYGAAEGFLDAATGGLTDNITDKGFDFFTKIGNRKIDMNNPDDVKFLKTQQQIRGYSGVGGAVGAGIVTGNVAGATGQSAKGLNTAFQASDWAGDDFKKWSNISSSLINTGSKIAGGAGMGAPSGGAGMGDVAGSTGNIGNLGKMFGGANSTANLGNAANTGLNIQAAGQGTQAVSSGLNSANTINSTVGNFDKFNTAFNKSVAKAKPYIQFADKMTGEVQEPLYKQAPDDFTNRSSEVSSIDPKTGKMKKAKQLLQEQKIKTEQDILAEKEKTGGERFFNKGGEMIKRADGSYSRRGLWDNIRANKGSGKAPTKEMLKQEAKIKAKYADGGNFDNITSKGEDFDYKKLLLPALGVAGGMALLNSANKEGMAKGGKLEHLGDNLYKVNSHIKGTDKVEVRPNVFFDDKEVVRKNPDGSMQILSDDLGYAKPVEKVAKAMGGKAAQSLFNTMYTKQEMSKSRRPVDKFADNANKRKSYVIGGEDNYPYKNVNLDVILPTDAALEDAEDMMITEKNLTLNNTNIPRVNAQIDKYNYYNNPEKYLKSKDEIKQFQTWVKQNKQTNLGNFGKNKDGIDGDLGKPGSLTRDAWNTYGNKFIQSKGRKVVEPITPIPYKKIEADNKPLELKKPKQPIEFPTLPKENTPYNMKQISPLWLAASEAGNIANLLMSAPDDIKLDRYKYSLYNPSLVDPYRANRLLAGELRKQANATSNAIRGTANTQGTYLASEVANRSRLNEIIGSQLTQANLQSILANNEITNKGKAINADIINKARLANLDISTMEKDLRKRELDASRTIRSQALSQMGSNIMQYGRDRKQVDMTNAMLPFIAGDNQQFTTDENGKLVLKRKSNTNTPSMDFDFTPEKKTGEKKKFGGKINKRK